MQEFLNNHPQYSAIICEVLSREQASFFIETFHKIPIFTSEGESRPSKRSELIGTAIFNSIKRKRMEAETEVSSLAENGDEAAAESRLEVVEKWKRAEPVLHMQIRVLLNIAEQKCKAMSRSWAK